MFTFLCHVINYHADIFHSVDRFHHIQPYVGNAVNPTNGVQPDFSQFQECGYFEGPATDGGPHFFKCPKMLRGRHVAVTIVDSNPAVINICEVKVCGSSASTAGM